MPHKNEYDLVIAVTALLCAMTACLVTGISFLYGLVAAFLLFVLLGIKRGYSARQLLRSALQAAYDRMRLSSILILIGLITGIWRACGTISYCIALGMELISPRWFLLITFLAASMLSYAMGSSIGVSGTMGVIFLSLARSAGVNELLTAGAVISGAFLGDRCSPSSTCANLVAAVTDTDLMSNIKRMFQTAALPYALTLLAFALLSVWNPVHVSATEIGTLLAAEQMLSPWLLLPFAAIVVLPLFRVKVNYAILTAIALSVGAAFFFQRMSLGEIVRCFFRGYTYQHAALSSLSGGGILSMIEFFLIVLVSSTYSVLLEQTGMLEGVDRIIAKLDGRLGRFPALLLSGIVMIMLFYNKTVAIVMTAQTWRRTYGTDQAVLAIDIENSVATLAGLVPWCVSCAGVHTILGVGPAVIPYCIYLYMVPLCYLFTRRFYIRRLFCPGAGGTDGTVHGDGESHAINQGKEGKQRWIS